MLIKTVEENNLTEILLLKTDLPPSSVADCDNDATKLTTAAPEGFHRPPRPTAWPASPRSPPSSERAGGAAMRPVMRD